MSVEIFTRSRFEQALSFLPLGMKLIGVSGGQLVYKTTIATKLTCACGYEFYPTPIGLSHVRCHLCGMTCSVSDKVIFPGELMIKIYSSIDPRTGYSRDTGKDSIRLVLCNGKGKPVGKVDKYTTRVKGWETRLRAKLRELWELGYKIPRCPKCKTKAKVGRCGSGQNKGRLFAKCWHHKRWLGWIK